MVVGGIFLKMIGSTVHDSEAKDRMLVLIHGGMGGSRLPHSECE